MSVIVVIVSAVIGYFVHWWVQRITKMEQAYEDGLAYLWQTVSFYESMLLILRAHNSRIKTGEPPELINQSYITSIRELQSSHQFSHADINKALARTLLYGGNSAIGLYFDNIKPILEDIRDVINSYPIDVDKFAVLVSSYRNEVTSASMVARVSLPKDSLLMPVYLIKKAWTTWKIVRKQNLTESNQSVEPSDKASNS